MMTAKARGKNQIVLFDEQSTERPDGVPAAGRDVRSIAHLKMLQSLAGKLNRLNDVRQIGEVIADELRLLIDYHNCRVSVIEGDEVVPIAFRGELRLARRRARRPAAHEDRRGHHRPRRGDRRAPARRQHARVRLRGDDPRHAHDRGVAGRGAALLRHARDRRDRDLEARRRPVRRGRRAPARGARRPCLGRARERAPLRGPAARGRPPEGAARVHGRDLARPRRPDEIGRETVQAASQMLGGKDCALWLPRENGDFRITAHSNYDAEPALRPMLDVVLPGGVVRAIVGDRTDAVPARRRGGAAPCPSEDSTGPTSPSRRSGHDVFLEGFISVREPVGGRAHDRGDPAPARRHLVPGRCRARARAQLREPRGHVRLDRRGAGERARGERRVHLVAHALDHRHGAQGRRGAGLRARRAEAARARRALPRHRQDRRSRRASCSSPGRSRRRSARSSRCTPSSASGSSSRSTGSPRCARSCAAATSAGTARATRTGRPARTSRVEAGSSSSATPSTR